MIGKIIEKGNRLLTGGDILSAYNFFKSAITQDPQNNVLADKIDLISKLLENTLPKKNNIDKVKIASIQMPKAIYISKKKNPPPIRPVIKPMNIATQTSWFNISDWKIFGLTDNDYGITNNEINFYASKKIKKVLSHESKKDINISVKIKFGDVSPATRAGIIFGYNSSEESGSERYLLFIVEDGGNFALLNVKNGQEEILKSFKSSAGLYNDNKSLKVKIKSLGPWVIIYLNDKLLGSWYGKDFIKGEIGFYSGPNTNVAFGSFTLNSAFKDN